MVYGGTSEKLGVKLFERIICFFFKNVYNTICCNFSVEAQICMDWMEEGEYLILSDVWNRSF